MNNIWDEAMFNQLKEISRTLNTIAGVLVFLAVYIGIKLW